MLPSGTCDTFPAMKRWKDFSIFGEGNAIGDRVVPIEIYDNNSDDDVEGMSRYADEASVINIESKVSLTAAIKYIIHTTLQHESGQGENMYIGTIFKGVLIAVSRK